VLPPITPEEAALAHLQDSAEVMRATAAATAPSIAAAVGLLVEAFRARGKLLICGNGGSAADCQHLAAELVAGRKGLDRPGLPALALTTDSSVLTAQGNDVSFESVFARQVQALGAPGDVLLSISTSGRSPNILLAVEAARARGMKVVALTGAEGPLAAQAHIAIQVPSPDTQHIQECHLAIGHVLSGLVKSALFGPPPGR
jgi:D-sedoheptulose 7-phosphate isomerase